jgi:putative flippase GtrA
LSLPTRQFARFAIVGATNTAITLVSYGLLVSAGIPPVGASAVAFALGAVNGYRLNRGWTFHSSRRGAAPGARYVAVQLAGLGVNAAGVAVAVGWVAVPRLAGEIAILPLVTTMTFLLSRNWVFQPTAQPTGR